MWQLPAQHNKASNKPWSHCNPTCDRDHSAASREQDQANKSTAEESAQDLSLKYVMITSVTRMAGTMVPT
jgi:hypothetical protein